jgi:hypothetical protein
MDMMNVVEFQESHNMNPGFLNVPLIDQMRMVKTSHLETVHDLVVGALIMCI